MCCVQEVRWRGLGFGVLGMEGRRYKLWWSGKRGGIDGVGVTVKEELCENLVAVRMITDRVMALVVF